MKRRLTALLAGCIAGAVQAGALVDLSAEASRPAANDMVRASVFSEASGKNPAELALRVNADIAEALKLIRAKAGVSVKSGQQATYPIYGQSQKIDGWRMRSELVLESKDQGSVSDLLGKLQQCDWRSAMSVCCHRRKPAAKLKMKQPARRFVPSKVAHPSLPGNSARVGKSSS
jgi:predicted secreted protein